jgi:hypothetical protein
MIAVGVDKTQGTLAGGGAYGDWGRELFLQRLFAGGLTHHGSFTC